MLIDFPQKTEGNISGGSFVPDGMIFDAAGRLYVAMCTGGVINVVEVPSGKLLRQYDAGGKQVDQLPLPRRLSLHDRRRQRSRLPAQARRRVRYGLRLSRRNP